MHNYETIILGSRKSLLAKKHVEIFELEFKKKIGTSSKIKIEKKFFKTSGDKFLNAKISDLGNKGLFTKEIDNALLNSEINLGIHSLKDLPTNLPNGIDIGAILKREDFRDVLITEKNLKLNDLKSNSIIGTSSIRREIQLKKIRPDLIIKSIRGNVDSRIRKLREKKFDGIILAHAGLKRLGIKGNFNILDPRVIIPALGQGAIALVINKKNKKINKVINKLNHLKTYLETECERIFLKALDGSCQTPVGGYAVIRKTGNEQRIFFSFIAFSKDGSIFVRDKVVFNVKNFRTECYKLGRSVKKKINK